jgi:hypothetical protein
MNYSRLILAVVCGILGAVVVDLDSFILARRTDPNAAFDWPLAIARWIKGGIVGATALLGFEAV